MESSTAAAHVPIKVDARRRAAYAQLCMVDDAISKADKLAADEVPFEDLQKQLVADLRSAWDKDGYRIAGVFTENVNAAFIHATVAVMETEEVRAVWPYWRFAAIMDQKTSRFCDSLNNTVRPAGESWWYDGRIPPLHFGGCRSLILGLTMKEAHKIGVTMYYPMVQGDVNHGYGYARRGFQPDLSKFPPELTQIYDQAVRETAAADPLDLNAFAAGIMKTWKPVREAVAHAKRCGFKRLARGARWSATDALAQPDLGKVGAAGVAQLAEIREQVLALHGAAVAMWEVFAGSLSASAPPHPAPQTAPAPPC